MGAQKENTFIHLSKDLANYLRHISLGVQVVTSHLNPLYWQSSAKNINSRLLSILLKDMKTQKEFHKIPKPLDMFLKIEEENVEDITVTFDIPRDEDGNLLYEENIPILHLQMNKGETIIVTLYPNKDIGMKVAIKQNELPSLEDVMSAKLINITDTLFPYYTVRTSEVAVDDDAWFFVALAPVVKSMDRSNFVLKYSFMIYTTTCQYWDTEIQMWVQEGCRVMNDTSKEILHCLCNHSSFYTGFLIKSAYKVKEFTHISFSLRSKHDLIMIIFVSVLLLIFIMALILAMLMDKSDKTKRKIIILADNFPDDHYAYLLTVYTGMSRNAGTTSTVGILLAGTSESSKPHMLISQNKTLFTTGATDWFVIFTPHSLGEVQGIYLWHNNTGHRPPWYCDAVVLRDIQTKQRWVFHSNRWLSLIRGKHISHCYLKSATDEQLHSQKIMFQQNIVYNFKENHMWLSILRRNPQSFFSRSQRVAVVVCGMALATIFNIVFYDIMDVSTTNPAYQLDSGYFHFNMKNVAFALISALLTLPLNFILTFLFRKSVAPDKYMSKLNRRRSISNSPNIYSDIEQEKVISGFTKYIFYSLPIDPLCQTLPSLEDRVFFHLRHVPILEKSKGEVFKPFMLPYWMKHVA